MQRLFACRLGCYGKYSHRAWTHLPEIGIRHVEMNVPATAESEAATMKLMRDHGMHASSFQGKVPLHEDTVVQQVRAQLETCSRFGTDRLFVSVKVDTFDRNIAIGRLRAIGDIAQKLGITVVMETHPDLVTNGDVGSQSMREINHPAIRINFDTANVYYYNHNVTTMGELRKVIDHVAAVHLKDTNGNFKDHDFPALGKGVVDFPAVFKALDARGFAGPYTMELEGAAMVNFTEQQYLDHVAESAAYLRSIGAMS